MEQTNSGLLYEKKSHLLVKRVNGLKKILKATDTSKAEAPAQDAHGTSWFPTLAKSQDRRANSNPNTGRQLNHSGQMLDNSTSYLQAMGIKTKKNQKHTRILSVKASVSGANPANATRISAEPRNLPMSNSLASLSRLDKSGFTQSLGEPILDSHGEVTQKIQLSLQMIELGLQKLAQGDLEGLVIVLDEIEHACLTFQARSLVTGFYQLYTLVLLDLGEYSKCVQTAKKLITDAEKQEDYPSMLFCYEIAGEALSKLKYFEESLKCYFMMLKVSLKLHNLKKELLSYDRIGLGYFHLNEMDKSEYFHRRMVEGKTEPTLSKLRNLQFNRQRATQLEIVMKTNPNSLDIVPDEELTDLVTIFFEPMAVDPKYREFDEKKRSALMQTELYQQSSRRVGNVKVYSNDSSMINLMKSSTSRKPMNRPQATLAHLSANRSVNIFDAISAQNSKQHFRFIKFGRDIKFTNKRRIKLVLEEYKELLVDAKARVVNLTNFVLSKPSLAAISSLGIVFKQNAKVQK